MFKIKCHNSTYNSWTNKSILDSNFVPGPWSKKNINGKLDLITYITEKQAIPADLAKLKTDIKFFILIMKIKANSIN